MLKSLSATSVSTYEGCPYRWNLNYNLKLLQLPNPAFFVGTMYHKALEIYQSKALKHELVIEQIKGLMLANTEFEDKIKMFGMVRNMFGKYVEYEQELARLPSIENEWRFRIQVPGLDIPLIGFVDRIIAGKVIEYKTTSKDFEQEDLNNIQTDIYSYAYFNRFGEMPTVIYSINNKKKAHTKLYKPQRLEIARSKEDMGKLELRLANTADCINKGNFEPTPSNQCYWCPFGKKGTNNCKYSK